MKQLLFMLMFIGLASLSFAQPAIMSNQRALVVKTVTTTDATPTTIATITPSDNEAGVLHIQVVGASVDTIAACTGLISYRYTKVNGTLTLGSVVTNDAIVADTRVSGATFSASTSNGAILIRVTGKAGITMHWKSLVTVMGIRDK